MSKDWFGKTEISRKFHKAMTWSKDDTGSPKDMESRVRKMSDKELLNLRGTDDDAKAGSGSARSAQIKMINREIRRRGIRESADLYRAAEKAPEIFGDIVGGLRL